MIVTVVISRTKTPFVYGPFPTKAHAEAWAMENLKGYTWQHTSVISDDSPLMYDVNVIERKEKQNAISPSI